MAEIVPAIVANDFNELEKKIKLVEPFVDWVQLDVMDGKFVPEKTGYASEDLKKLDTKLNLEAHLMIAEPEKEIDRWTNSGVKRILVHWEAIMLGNRELGIRNWEIMREKCVKCDIELGLVLNLETPIEVLENVLFIIHNSKFIIQLMSIARIGHYGEPFDERVIPKIKVLREIFPDVKIALDGGIDKETTKLALTAGADILAVGSAIFGSNNIEETIWKLRRASNK